jgi:hypothetical protein
MITINICFLFYIVFLYKIHQLRLSFGCNFSYFTALFYRVYTSGSQSFLGCDTFF